MLQENARYTVDIWSNSEEILDVKIELKLVVTFKAVATKGAWRLSPTKKIENWSQWQVMSFWSYNHIFNISDWSINAIVFDGGGQFQTFNQYIRRLP